MFISAQNRYSLGFNSSSPAGSLNTPCFRNGTVTSVKSKTIFSQLLFEQFYFQTVHHNISTRSTLSRGNTNISANPPTHLSLISPVSVISNASLEMYNSDKKFELYCSGQYDSMFAPLVT